MPFNKKIESSWIEKKIDKNCIAFAEEFGEYLSGKNMRDDRNVKPLTSSQIRIFFGEIKRIQLKGFDKEKSAFLLIRPKLAYAEARAKGTNIKSKPLLTDFRRVIEQAHLAVGDSEENFTRFVAFLEAILAYHKAYGGRN